MSTHLLSNAPTRRAGPATPIRSASGGSQKSYTKYHNDYKESMNHKVQDAMSTIFHNHKMYNTYPCENKTNENSRDDTYPSIPIRSNPSFKSTTPTTTRQITITFDKKRYKTTTMVSIQVDTDLTAKGQTIHSHESGKTFIHVTGVTSPSFTLSLYLTTTESSYEFQDINWLSNMEMRHAHRKRHGNDATSSFYIENKCDENSWKLGDTLDIEVAKRMFPLSSKCSLKTKSLPSWKIKCVTSDNHVFYSEPFIVKSKRSIAVQDACKKKQGILVQRSKRKRKCKDCIDLQFKYNKSSEIVIAIENQKKYYEDAYNNLKANIEALNDLIRTHPHTPESAFLQAAIRITAPKKKKKLTL